jgi:hypothetical protein
MDVYEIHVTARNTREHAIQGTPPHSAVFGILGHARRSDSQNPRLVMSAFV